MSLVAPLFERAPTTERDPHMADEWLTVRETATLLRLHRNTIYTHLRDGTLPCRSKRVGRVWRINATDANDLLSALAYLLAEPELLEPES